MNNLKETIICSAIWYKEFNTPTHNVKNINVGVVLCGHRHPHIVGQIKSLTGKRSVIPEVGQYEQGFLTNKNRFVNRNEAAKIAQESGQIKWTDVDWNKVELYSEDIY